MNISDYFNYMSAFATVVFLVALLVLIPLGIFLCRYKLKYVLLAILGLILTTVYFSQLMMLVVNYLKSTNHNTLGLVLQFVLPACFFAAGVLGIVSWGLHIWVNRANKKIPSSVTQTILLPGKLKQWRQAFRRWITSSEGICVCVIEVIILFVHLLYISQPSLPAVMDEAYYVPEAYRFLHHLPMAITEHPPLGKWFIASGMFIFGNNPVGWRIFSVIFGIVGIFIFYLICKKLTVKWPQASPFVPLLGTFLLASENLTFVMAHVAMLDVFYFTLMLLAFLLYLRSNYFFCGVIMGLSLLCKVTAVLGILVIILHWIITRRREIAAELHDIWDAVNERAMKFPLSGNILKMFQLLVAAAAVWFLLIVPLEYGSMHQFSSNTLWYNPFFRAVYMIWHPLNETAASYSAGMLKGGNLGMGRLPLQWILTPSALNVNFAPGSDVPRYLASIGWNIWIFIIPSFIYLVYLSVKIHNKDHEIALFLSCWLLCVYGLLVAIQAVTGRLTFDYYFYPAVPAVCLTIAWGFWRIWEVALKRVGTKIVFTVGLSLYLLASLAVFVIMSPLGTNFIRL